MKKRIPIAFPTLNGNEKKYVNNCLDTTWISSLGAYIDQFEEKFAEYCGSKYAISCSNGTVGLHIPLLALGIKEGDEVIIPTLTYIATANAVSYCKATPVLIDSDEKTWNIDPSKIEDKITSCTKAIIVVHLYGHPVDMDPIMQIAKKYNLFVIEDAAEAHGALYKGKKVGSIGHVGVFSFFGNKIITTGEGGMITTDDKTLASKMRNLKGQGMDPEKRYWFPIIGYNYRMTNIQAAIGLAQLEQIDNFLVERKIISVRYNQYLEVLQDYIEIQVEQPWARHSYWMYSIVLKDKVKLSRDELMHKLEEVGIETRPIFYPMHVMPPYFENEKYPISEKLSSRGLNLPTHGLLKEEDIQYICDYITLFIKE